jgi:competence ComEA-like helix-hairpin-helix protein
MVSTKETEGYRRNRQIILWVMLVVLAGTCVYRYWGHRSFVGQPLVVNDEVKPLADKINPNTASWASLARLPGIGPTLARAIVDYREEYYKNHNGQGQPFTCREDLMQVKRIGPAISAQIEEFLVFDEP